MKRKPNFDGLDAIIVSNHGGRDDDFGRSTTDALPEIIEAVDGRIPALVKRAS